MQSVATPLIEDFNSCNYTCRRGEQSMTPENCRVETFIVQNNGKVNILASPKQR